MSFCLVVDASCDLPDEYSAHPQLRLLPVHVFVGGQRFLDTRDAGITERFQLTNLAAPDAVEGRSEPLSVDEMLVAFNNHLSSQFDQVLGVFVASSRSAIYARAQQVIGKARVHSYATRARAGKLTNLQVDCLDSKALFAGYAAQVIDMLQHLERGHAMFELIERQRRIVSDTYTYMTPGDVSYILRRAAIKGEKSVSGLAAFAAKALAITPILRAHQGNTAPVGKKLGKLKARDALVRMGIRCIELGILRSKNICLSYSGDLHQIIAMPAFEELAKKAKAAGVALHLANMSMTGSVNVGPDSLCIGFVAQAHEPAQLL